jgi:PAS domain S-box-containing protein
LSVHDVNPLLDTAPCGFLSFRDDGVVTRVNQTLLAMLGYERAQVVGQHVERLLPIGTRIFYQTHWFPLLRLHGRADEIFLFMKTKAGEDIGLLSYAQRSPAGDEACYDCIFVHVRERAKYEAELLRAKREAEAANGLLEEQAIELELQQQQLEEASRAKSSFLATMSHELRTPLNAIGGYVQILELGIHGPITDAQRDVLHRIDKGSTHLLGLINEVLNLSRIEAGQVDYDLREVAVADLITDTLPLIEPQAGAKRLTLSVEKPASLQVRADIEKAHQILVNILGNAVKFTNEGGRISVRCYEDDERVCIDVADTGVGIATEKLDAIFEPFVQVDSSHTRKAQGTGLGLAISRDLARGMNGDLTASSVLNTGSVFTLCLPRA